MIQEQLGITSHYVPYLCFSKESQQRINEQFIKPKVDNFFTARKLKQYQAINVNQYISDIDFNTPQLLPFEYFYKHILYDITKMSTYGKIKYVMKYGITLDERMTDKICEETKIKYSEILLYKKPIFYFIYIDLKEIISFLR